MIEIEIEVLSNIIQNHLTMTNYGITSYMSVSLTFTPPLSFWSLLRSPRNYLHCKYFQPYYTYSFRKGMNVVPQVKSTMEMRSL